MKTPAQTLAILQVRYKAACEEAAIWEEIWSTDERDQTVHNLFHRVGAHEHASFCKLELESFREQQQGHAIKL